jgi:uncharacterized surface protein with fasciclin (FAS1) repeats
MKTWIVASLIGIAGVTGTAAAGGGTTCAASGEMAHAPGTIVETAAGSENFKTLTAAIKAAGLAEALGGKGPFTVFAPTDEAFAKLPKETVDSLLKPENKEQLAGILKYHVVPGRVYSVAAAKGASVATLQGTNVTTQSSAGKVMVENATVTAADLDASNGVIHVIDTVILPKK